MGFIVVPVSLAIVPLFGARLTEEEEIINTKRHFGRFQVSYLEHSNGSYKWLR